MAVSKLTLTASPEIIEMAAEQAKREGTSISAMFANFILAKSQLQTQRRRHRKIGPLTKALTGVIKLPDDFDEKDFISDVFIQKYGLGK